MPAKCSSCGADLPADAPGGHCLHCLLRLGLAAAESETTAESLHLKPGDRIGHYQLVEQLGEGGCGVVFLATQLEPVRREVALKVIKLGMDTQQVLARFEAERQVLALLDHPHIAKVLDAGATDAGRPFFVMELVRGEKITDYCDHHKLSTRQRLELFVQVCAAVQHAHQKGIIHRDLKPSNLLVADSESGPVPKIIDFGIAKSTEQRLAGQTFFTAFQQFLGTPAYMSPEQAGLMDIDTRSDIYSLGVLLYELLTGLAPFDPATLHERALDEVMRFIRETEPPRPSTRLTNLTPPQLHTVADCRRSDAVRLPRLLEGDLDWIVMKCLEVNRARRYANASTLGADLLNHLNHEPVAARPPGNLYRFQKWTRRHRLAFAAGAAVFASLLIGLVVSTTLFFKERAAENAEHNLRLQTETLHQTALTEAGQTRETAKFLEAALQGVGPSVALGRDTAMLHEILDQTAAHIDRELQSQPDIEADLRATLADTYGQLGDYSSMSAMATRALELNRRHTNASPAIAHNLAQLGDAQIHLGNLTTAEATDREALALTQKLFPADSPEITTAQANLAAALLAQQKYPAAETLLKQTLATQREHSPADPEKIAVTLSALGAAQWKQNKFAEAESNYREALAIRKKIFGPEHPDIAVTLNNLATVLLSLQNFSEAETLTREALATQRKILGNDHPAVATTLANLANALAAQNKLSEAEAADREALAITRKSRTATPANLIHRLNRLASDLTAEHRYQEAKDLTTEAQKLRP